MVEENLLALQFLLSPASDCAHSHLRILLHYHSICGANPWGYNSSMGSGLYPYNNYIPQCFRNSKVRKTNQIQWLRLILIPSISFLQFGPFAAILDLLWKRRGSASYEGGDHRSVGGRQSKWMGCYWQTWRHFEEQHHQENYHKTQLKSSWKVIIIIIINILF